MRIRLILLIIALIGTSMVSPGCRTPETDDEVAVLETAYGRIVIEFLPRDAPNHVTNFKELVQEGFYDGTRFHRLVKQGTKYVAIQGGDPNTVKGDPSTWGQGQPGQKTVAAEFSKTLKHVRGTVSAARKSNDPNSAASQFFICAGPEPKWDGQYSIFGRVIEGLNVVDSILRAPMWPNTDKPIDPVVVSKVTIQKRDQVKPAGT
jgi:peptidyl-prolyl cis-trans isomerase B (cyclophilin B)